LEVGVGGDQAAWGYYDWQVGLAGYVYEDGGYAGQGYDDQQLGDGYPAGYGG
jgi:hypothetical protein